MIAGRLIVYGADGVPHDAPELIPVVVVGDLHGESGCFGAFVVRDILPGIRSGLPILPLIPLSAGGGNGEHRVFPDQVAGIHGMLINGGRAGHDGKDRFLGIGLAIGIGHRAAQLHAVIGRDRLEGVGSSGRFARSQNSGVL